VVGDEATVRVCMEEDLQRIAIDSGNVLEESDSVFHWDLSLRRIDGVWKRMSTDEVAEPCSVG
jgi:hypothetical protein